MHKTSAPRVLFLMQTHNIWGGMESWVHNFSLWLQDREWDVHFAFAKGARFNDPDRYYAAHPHILNRWIMDASVGTESARIRSIIRTCASCKPDILIPIALGAVFPAVEQLKSGGAQFRFILPIRSMFPAYIQNAVDYFSCIDQVVVVNRLLERFFESRFPNERDRIHYIERGVAAPFAERGESNGALRVGFVGRLEQSSKRIFDLVELCENLVNTKVPLEIHVFGDGPDRDELHRRLIEHRVEANVRFHGYLTADELYRVAYPTLDVLLLFSETEGSPTVVYEAMHHGVVPLISRYLGHACDELVQHGINGFTFPVADIKTAVHYLKQLAARPALFQRLSDQARNDVSECVQRRMQEEWEMTLRLALERQPRFSKGALRRQGASSRAGRLERLMPSQRMTDFVRHLSGRRFPHKAGFEEWPGSQPVSPTDTEELQASLLAIEHAAQMRTYHCNDGLTDLESVPTAPKLVADQVGD